MIVSKNPVPIIISLLTTLFITVSCSSTKADSLEQTVDSIQLNNKLNNINIEKAIVLGDISDNPRKKIRKFQPLADYLATNLTEFDQGMVKVAPDLDTMIAWLKSGEVDMYIDSPYPAMLAINEANAKPILRRWKKDSAEYHSLIFTLDDRNIASLSDLKGKIVAFDHPASTTGYMLPFAKLSESGVMPQEISSFHSPLSKNSVGYIFSNEDENSIEWLLNKKVSAAAVDNLTFEKLPPEIKTQAIVLAETEKVARNLVLVAEDMSPKDIDAISKILLTMDQTEAGKSTLEKFGRTTKFDDFPLEQSLDKMQQLYQQTQK